MLQTESAPGSQQMGIRYHPKLDQGSSHAVISGWLRACPPGSRVLDVGAATGTLARMLTGSGLVLDGVEPQPEWAAAARPFYRRMTVSTLEAAPDQAISGYSAVVCADVLEHTAEPEHLLARLVRLQPEGALFLLSVPNVAHLWVRLNLLFGRFEYTDRGILDRTHLRFFTRASLLRMAAAAGLRVEELRATPVPLNLLNPFFEKTPVGRTVHAVMARITGCLPDLLGYQFVIRAVKPPAQGA